MKPEEVEYVRFRMARAYETLSEAKSLLETGTLYGVVNRLYYACFYAVSALLFTEGMSSAKHRGIIALLDRQWIKTGRLPAAMGRFYRRLFELRQQGDYGYPVTFERETVKKWIGDADALLTELSRHFDEKMREENPHGPSG